MTSTSIARTLRYRVAACWRVLVHGDGTAIAPQAVPPGTGDRVLQVSVGGTFSVAVPDGLDPSDPSWIDWEDAAIRTAFEDGRWLDCTEVEDIVVGVLDERGWAR